MTIFYRYIGIFLGILALLIRFLMRISPEIASFYTAQIFPIIRNILDITFGKLPFTATYILIPFLIALFIFRLPAFKKFALAKSWARFIRWFLNLSGLLYFLFNFLWGFNYESPGIADRLQLISNTELNPQGIKENYLQTMQRSMEYRNQILGADTISTIMDIKTYPDAAVVRELMKTTLGELGYKTSGNARVRYIIPEGILRKFGIAGIYNPFTGEPNVDSSYGILQHLFTTAHELAHAYGITGEAEANFAAYISLMKGDDPIFKYAADYVFWRHLASEATQILNQEDLDIIIQAIPNELKSDRAAIRMNSLQYGQWFPDLSRAVNDTYLKAQGIEKGTADYDYFVNLVFTYNEKRRSTK